MADYATQVSQQRDRITQMLDRPPTLGQVGRAALSSLHPGKTYADELQKARTIKLAEQMTKLQFAKDAQSEDLARQATEWEKAKFGMEYGLSKGALDARLAELGFQREKFGQEHALARQEANAKIDKWAAELGIKRGELDARLQELGFQRESFGQDLGLRQAELDAKRSKWAAELGISREQLDARLAELGFKERKWGQEYGLKTQAQKLAEKTQAHRERVDLANLSINEQNQHLAQARFDFDIRKQSFKEVMERRRVAIEEGNLTVAQQAQETANRLANSLVQYRIDELTVQRARAETDRERYRLDKQIFIMDQLAKAAERRHADGEHILSVFSELTENATAESVGNFAEALFDLDQEINAKNAMELMAPLAAKHLKDQPTKDEYETKYSAEMGTWAAQSEIGLYQAASGAEVALSEISELKDILSVERTTALTPLVTRLQSWARPLGIDIEGMAENLNIDLNNVENIQRFNMLASKLVLDVASRMKGALSNKELDFATKATLNAGTSWGANVRALMAMEMLQKRIRRKGREFIRFKRQHEAEGKRPENAWRDFGVWWDENGGPLEMPKSARSAKPEPEPIGTVTRQGLNSMTPSEQDRAIGEMTNQEIMDMLYGGTP